MYQVVSFMEYGMTRDVKLKNTKTGTIDTCFDDSELVSCQNFSFMEKNKKYDCKILLFGDEVKQKTNHGTVCCRILCRDILVGRCKLIKVLVANDVYYIMQNKIKNITGKSSFWFEYTRKDLVQVDDVVHADFLREWQ